MQRIERGELIRIVALCVAVIALITFSGLALAQSASTGDDATKAAARKVRDSKPAPASYVVSIRVEYPGSSLKPIEYSLLVAHGESSRIHNSSNQRYYRGEKAGDDGVVRPSFEWSKATFSCELGVTKVRGNRVRVDGRLGDSRELAERKDELEPRKRLEFENRFDVSLALGEEALLARAVDPVAGKIAIYITVEARD